MRLNRDTTFNESPAVALDGQGRPMVVWSGKGGPEGGTEDFDIWFATASSASFTGASDWQLFE